MLFLIKNCKKCRFDKVDLSSTNLDGTNPRDAIFQITNLPNAKLSTEKLILANLRSANLCVIEFYQADLINSSFEFANLVVTINI
jgi:uncharacterized protein YjbI with pentapeptide repeats